MNWFKRTLAAITGKRSHDMLGPRWPEWAAVWAQNRQALAARHRQNTGAAYLIGNTPTAEGIAEKFVTNLIGDGPAVRSKHPNANVAAALVDGFGEFYSRAGIDGADLTGVLATCVRSLVSNGEFFVRLITVERGELRLQCIPVEQIDPTRNADLGDGRRDIAGIRFDGFGRPVGYWILPDAPDRAFAMVGPSVLVDAADICHGHERRFPGQVRGNSWLAPVATRLVELSKLEDALLARMNTAALFAGFITGDGTGGFEDANKSDNALSLEPGVLRDLRGLGNTAVTFTDVPDTSGAPELLTHMMRSIASGIAMPYPVMASNYGDVNYSSGSLGMGQFIRRIKQIQASLLAAQFLDKVWARFVTLEILTGRLAAPDFASDPRPYFAASWMWPAWPSLNPYDETRADVLAVDNGLRSRQEVIAARGRDPSEVDAEIGADLFPRTSLPVGASNA